LSASDSPGPVSFTVWSDFLCPWCYVAAVRLDALHREVGAVVEIRWRSFLLRPEPSDRTLEQFTRYTESWARPGGAEPAAVFTRWSGDHAPPSHSFPSAIAGKAVLHAFGPDGFDRFHLALMRAYFAENRTISDRAVILDVADTAGLDADVLATVLDRDADALRAEVIADHKAALAQGIAAVPTVLVDNGFEDGEYMLQGAMALDQYRKVVARLGG
jgi:predicted DsbA family dithiol-disulfide isomerase